MFLEIKSLFLLLNNIGYLVRIMYYVYKLVFPNTERFYVGQSANLDERREKHWTSLVGGYHHNTDLQTWFNDNKPQTMEMVVLLEVGSREEAATEEVRLIEDTYDINFNISKKAGGGDLISYHPNREAISQKHRENYFKQVREGTRLPFTAKSGQENPNYKHGRQTKETINNAKCVNCKVSPVKVVGAMCKKCLGAFRSETSMGEDNSFFGRKHTDEVKERLSKLGKERISKGFLPTNSRKVVAEGVLFKSCAECARHYGVSQSLITYRIKSSNWDFEYFSESAHSHLLY